MSVTVDRLDFPQRIGKGQKAEHQVMAVFRSIKWTVLPYGEARPNAPVPYLETPIGPVRPCDFIAYSPDGRSSYVVEVKAKGELRVGGYGLDTAEAGQVDCWEELQRHDRHAGPVLLVIVDPDKETIVCATVRMLANPGPTLSANGRMWRWPANTFMPLIDLLRQ